MSFSQTADSEIFKRPKTPPDSRTSSRTPAKETFSTEKLKRKLNIETTKLRKERRDNLFNKQRINLESSPSNALLTNGPSSSETVVSQVPAYQSTIPNDHLLARQSNQPDYEMTSNLSTLTKTIRKVYIAPDQLEEKTKFYKDLESKYLTFKQTASHENAQELVLFIDYFKNIAVLNSATNQFRQIAIRQSELFKYLREDLLNSKENDGEYAVYPENYSKLVIDVIALVHEVMNTLTDYIFNDQDPKLIKRFAILMTNLHYSRFTTFDEKRHYLVIAIQYLSNRKTLELNEIPMYCFLLENLDHFLTLRNGKPDDIWTCITSVRFLKLLKQHTKLACQVIRSLRTITSISNSDCTNSTGLQMDTEMQSESDSQPVKLPTPYQAKRHISLSEREYVSDLFSLALAQSTKLMFEGYELPDDLHQLISNLKQLAAYDLCEEQFSQFIQILNNYFDPSLDDSVLDFLLPLQFIEQTIDAIKVKCNKILDPKNELSLESSHHVRWISFVIGLFSNVTSMDKYCQTLIDLKLTDQLANLVAITRGESFLNLLFYNLVMIRNMLRAQIWSENLSGFAQFNSFDIYQTIFQPTFVQKLLGASDEMNGDCKEVLSEILVDVSAHAKPAVLGQFINLEFFRILNDLLKMNDANLAMNTLQVLCVFVKQGRWNSEQSLLILNYIDAAGVIDNVEALIYSLNSQINRLASNLVDQYYTLSELKENMLP